MKPGCGILVSLFLLLALAATNGWWAYRSFMACAVFPFHDASSADGRQVVSLLYNNCGATMPFTTQAVMHPSGQPLRTHDYTPFLVVHGLHDMQIRWLDDARVEVTLPRGEEVYRRDEKVQGIAMLYR